MWNRKGVHGAVLHVEAFVRQSSFMHKMCQGHTCKGPLEMARASSFLFTGCIHNYPF